MCRSIKTLRPPYVDEATSEDVSAAALQYVRKIAGMRKPSAANQQAFDEAVADIAAATEHLLGHLQLRPQPARAPQDADAPPDAPHAARVRQPARAS
jgi:hypothetical protein